MSEAFHIISDGSCDLPEELVKEKNVTVVPFYVSFDKEHYYKENVEIGIRDFYQQMVDNKGVYPKSSMPSTQDYVDVFEPFAKESKPVICICITIKIQRFHAVCSQCGGDCKGRVSQCGNYSD